MRSLGVFLVFLSGVLSWISVSGGLVTINIHRDTTIHINRTETAQLKCEVCVGSLCQSSVTVRHNTEVNFTCTQPEGIFTVEIVKHIVCNSTCNGTITPEEYPSLQNFSRTFTWNVTVLNKKALGLDFSSAGLRQIQQTESCQDKHVYTVLTGMTTIGRFCRYGAIKGMQVPYEGRIYLQVPGKQQLDPATFGVSVEDEITFLANIAVRLPEEKSSQEFFSPNYPGSFPDEESVTWSFQVPPKHFTTVHVLNYTEPKCQKRKIGLEYEMNGKTVVKKLSEPQLTEHQGPFSLSLENCKTILSSNLSLHLKISANRRSSEVRCTVDLKKEEGLEIHIKKKKPTSPCILKLNSGIQETVTISSPKASFLTFIDCTEEDLLLNINQSIACQKLADCQSSKFSLRVPELDRCLPGVLQQVTWHLFAPQYGAVELMSPTGSLQQSLPGQTCDNSILLTLTEQDQQGITVGQFCPQGPVQKVQIRGNVTVTASLADGRNLRQITYSLLNLSFTDTVKEQYIFTISPKKDIPVLLATPAWPEGMRAYTTASWIVSVPPQLDAQVEFVNITQVNCENRHTSIKVQKQSSRYEAYIWRMDEKPKNVTMEESFYLNMSNCKPLKGSFSVVSQITLIRQKNQLLSIILSVVSVLLVLMVIVLAVVCVINRKKKKRNAPDVSVYNPNGHAFLPGLHGIPQTREDEDVHIYHCIDDTMVYGHLLKGRIEMNQFEPAVDEYHDFTGSTERQPLKQDGVPGRALGPDVGVYRAFSGPHCAPELPDRSPLRRRSPDSKDELITDKGKNGESSVQDQSYITPELERSPITESEEEDSEIRL